MNVHALRGCAPEPLAFYLKALGVMRLVAEQADREARGFWKDECFHLVTTLDRAGLIEFFLERYEPTPLVAPWNKGAGFYRADDPALVPLERSTAPRYGRLRSGIRAARALVDEIARADAAVRAIKDEAKKGSKADRDRLRADPQYKRRLALADRTFAAAKKGLIPRCRLAWRGPEREWLDAALVLGEDAQPVFPALLGTGGNDGRLDFTNNFYQRLAEVFDLSDSSGAPHAVSQEWFESALFNTSHTGMRSGIAVGQFHPGRAGGANASNGTEGNSRLNPVDFILGLEGSVLFRGHVAKRLDARERAQASAPFTVSASPAGYATGSGGEDAPRGEQWMPLWTAPIRLSELRQLFAEGRARLGQRSVEEPVDFARAVARFGTARGINEFQRFGYLERNGQSNLAVPLGRFLVAERNPPALTLLDELDRWLVQLKRQARGKNAGNRLMDVEQRISNGVISVAQHPGEPVRWQRLLLALSLAEAVMASGSGFAAGPVPILSPAWVAAADDGSPELRLALAFALQAGVSRGESVDPIRRHWLPLDSRRARFETTGDGGQKRLARRPDVVMLGRSPVTDAVALVERRAVESSQAGLRHIGLRPARAAAAAPADLALLLQGRVDLERTLGLARAFMALDGRRWSASPCPPTRAPMTRDWPDDAWVAMRLALLPWPLEDGRDIGNDPAVVRTLAGGDAATALEVAARRLRAAGLGCPVRTAPMSPATARLWAAALAFPIDRNSAQRMARRLDPSANNKELAS